MGSTRATRGRVSHIADYLFIHSSFSLAEARVQSQGDTQVRGSLRRDPTMSCQQIIASNHFPGSLFSDKTRDCIQPPPPALMPTIKTESSLHSSLSQLHFYGRNFQRSSSLNLPRFFHLPPILHLLRARKGQAGENLQRLVCPQCPLGGEQAG